MKKIKEFIDKTLETFIVSINYEKDLSGIDLEKISPLGNQIGHYYSNKPKLGLIKRRPKELIRLGHLQFMDSDKLNYVNLGEDFIDFIFNKYEKWERELPKIIHVFEALKEATDVPNIAKIVLTYKDVFEIPKENFSYNDYFTFPIINNGDWNIKFHDIFIGFVPYEELSETEKEKIVLRLKSRGIKDDKYILSLETVGSVDNCSIIPNSDLLKKYLEESHDRIEDFFISFLSPQYQAEKGLEIEEID